MPTVYHDSWDPLSKVEVFLTEKTRLLVDECVHEGIDLVFVEVWWVLCLLKEVSGGILQRLHNNLNIVQTV